MGAWDAISGFGSSLAAMIGIGVESSDRRSANELNYWSQMNTNKTNADINESQLAAARENWAREQANFEMQRKWSLEDRAYENWYNSPAQVAERYRKAGLNPALMMQGQGSVGSASASQGQAPQFGSPPGSIPMQAAHFEPTMQGFGLSMQKAIDTYMMAMRNEADIAAIKQRTDNETAETLANLSMKSSQSDYNKMLTRKLFQDWEFNRDTYADRQRAISLGNEKMRADVEYQKAVTYYQDLVNEFTPSQQKVLLREYDARYKEILSAVRKNDTDSALAVARKAVEEANRKGLDISNEQSERMADAIVGKAYAEEDRSWFESGQAAKRYYGGEAGYRLPLSGFTDNDLYNRRIDIDRRRHHKGSHYNYYRPE